MDTRNRNFIAIFIIVAVVAVIVMITNGDSDAAAPDCTDVVTVVDQEAFTEEVVHPEVVEVVHHEAVPAVTERSWLVWTGGPVEGPPAIFDEDGNVLEAWNTPNGSPNGVPHQQPDGVPYQVGNGNGDWFLWLTVTITEEVPAYDEEVVVEEAWTELVEHEAVTHDEEIATDCIVPPTDPKPVAPVEAAPVVKAPVVEAPAARKVAQVPTVIDAGL